jgi:hypothetical protein
LSLYQGDKKMTLTAFPNGASSFGIPMVGIGGRTAGGSMFGNNYFVDVNLGSNGNTGKSPDKAWKTLTYAFSRMTALDDKNATVFVAPGDYSGNYSSPLNGDAPFVSLIGVQATDIGFGPWAAASTTSSPIISMRARGWRISGFEFDGATTSSSLLLTTSGTSNSNFTQIDNCLFTGGKYGIDWSGAPTYTKIYNCLFEDITTQAFICSDSSTDTPRRCIIQGNIFQENAAHIAMNPRGFKASTIKDNVFHLDGLSRDATVLLDTRGGGGNAIVDNTFDITAAQYTDDAGTAFIRTAATDFGAGNKCNDGVAAAAISA